MKALDSFTVERLEELSVEEDLYNFPPTQEELNSLARIALAVKMAEPVGYWNDACDLDDGAFSYANDAGCTRPLYTTPQLNSPEIPDGWKMGKFGYQDLFNAIASAVSSPHAGGFSISVKAFEESMLAAAPEK